MKITKNCPEISMKSYEIDYNEYAKGTKITDKEIQSLSIERDAFHGEWNYTIVPR